MHNYTSSVTNTHGGEPSQREKPLGSLDNFLKLFLSQIQYQDPLNPVQDHEFIAQLAQFSQLEATQATNGHLNDIGLLLKGSLAYQGLQLLGKEVYFQTEEGTSFGPVTGITYEAGWPSLLVNGQRVEMGQVLQINLAPPMEGGGESDQQNTP
ncbi:MAG: flagellar hook capping protein [Firmicutes bacterium]|nr:flagellar hook capping protein [Bacillota bacterium]